MIFQRSFRSLTFCDFCEWLIHKSLKSLQWQVSKEKYCSGSGIHHMQRTRWKSSWIKLRRGKSLRHCQGENRLSLGKNNLIYGHLKLILIVKNRKLIKTTPASRSSPFPPALAWGCPCGYLLCGYLILAPHPLSYLILVFTGLVLSFFLSALNARQCFALAYICSPRCTSSGAAPASSPPKGIDPAASHLLSTEKKKHRGASV